MSPTRIAVAGALAVLAACDSPSRGTETPAATPTPPPPPINTGPSPPPPAAPPLAVTCTARPRSGEAPLRVDFTASPAGGSGAYTYDWDFGDGGEGSRNPSPSHTYASPGVFEATVRIGDGAQGAACARTVTVTPPDTGARRLQVVVSGPTAFGVGSPGTPLSCNNPPRPNDVCTLSLAQGAALTVGAFRAVPAPGPPPVRWTGDCANVFPTNTSWACTVVMDGDRTVVATSF